MRLLNANRELTQAGRFHSWYGTRAGIRKRSMHCRFISEFLSQLITENRIELYCGKIHCGILQAGGRTGANAQNRAPGQRKTRSQSWFPVSIVSHEVALVNHINLHRLMIDERNQDLQELRTEILKFRSLVL